ncbi:MAG: C40 family peptidase, partial [Acidimicrobiales bacterium]
MSVGSAVLAYAQSKLGQPYLYGGAPTGGPTDCSGLAAESWAAVGISIPRTTYDQYSELPPAVGSLQPGDLVFTQGSDPQGNLPGHVGIYAGNDEVIQDPQTGSVVSYSSLADFGQVVGVRRPSSAGARPGIAFVAANPPAASTSGATGFGSLLERLGEIALGVGLVVIGLYIVV